MVYVTGEGADTRAPGFAAALTEVFAKVSGDATLIDAPAVADLTNDAGGYVVSFSYRDRMAGIPVHDEQGTRQRPYELTVVFAQDKVDAALHSLGRKRWTGERPTVAVLASVANGPTRYLLTSDGAAGRDMRTALAVAGQRVGLALALPTEDDVVGIELADDTALQASLGEVAARMDPAASVVGTLTWSDRELGWVADWSLAGNGAPLGKTAIRGVSFDAAFLTGLRALAQELSGNGGRD
jgi:hypothetical protein